MASLSPSEKERFLKALEEDREFRYALMGLLGFKEILDRIVKLEERFARIEEEMRETRRVVLTIAHRFGVLSEEAFREAMKYVVEDALGVARVERWAHHDREGVVYGHPAIVEVDVVVRDREHLIVEVKSRVSKADVAELHRIAMLYEKVEGVKPQPVVVGGFIDPEAERLAKRLGVRIVPVLAQSY